LCGDALEDGGEKREEGMGNSLSSWTDMERREIRRQTRGCCSEKGRLGSLGVRGEGQPGKFESKNP